MRTANIIDHFGSVPDPREDNRRHKLIDILFIVICATLEEEVAPHFADELTRERDSDKSEDEESEIEYYKSVDTGRGRVEVRECWASVKVRRFAPSSRACLPSPKRWPTPFARIEVVKTRCTGCSI